MRPCGRRVARAADMVVVERELLGGNWGFSWPTWCALCTGALWWLLSVCSSACLGWGVELSAEDGWGLGSSRVPGHGSFLKT